MMDIIIFYLVLATSLVLFVTGWFRYDVVGLMALLALVIANVVPVDEAFSGFANPAVVTVVAVLVISKALEVAGITDLIGRAASSRVGSSHTAQVGFFCGLVAILSSFINNVGALALMIPVAIDLAKRMKRSPSYLLMPMAFSSLLGGMTTLIGTPPNLLVSQYRATEAGEQFGMFDFTPVGLPIMIAGVLFLALVGWRLIPKRTSGVVGELFEIAGYIGEAKVPSESSIIGKPIRDIFQESNDVTLVGFRRDDERYSVSDKDIKLHAGDVLILRADPQSLKLFIETNHMVLGGVKPTREDLKSGDMELVEAVVMKGSTIEDSTARRLDLRAFFAINLIAVARKGATLLNQRLKDIKLHAGDVLLLQMPRADMKSSLARLGLLPLARRDLAVLRPRRLVAALTIFGLAIAATALNYYPSAISFSVAAIAMIVFGVISVRDASESIDWSVVLLLGSMIPVGNAFETSGAVRQMTTWISSIDFLQSPIVMLVVVIIVTMCLSDILNNAATAIVMSPFASGLAKSLGVSSDPFLLAVAIGASCAFLTPIGHQSNTLVMGPGGYRFGDYFKMGVLLEIVVGCMAVLLLYWFWGLAPVAE